MEGLTEKQIEEYRNTFGLFDKNGDGTISFAELAAAMHDLGIDVTQNELRAIHKDADKNADKKIDFEEFCEMLKKRQNIRSVVDNMNKAFEEFDEDGDGHITREELCKAMSRLGINLNEVQIEEMVLAADTNNDGKINYSEFAVMYSLK